MTKIINEILYVYFSDLSKKCRKTLVKFLTGEGYDAGVIEGITKDVNVVTYIGLPEKLIKQFNIKKEMEAMDGMVS